MFEKESSLIAKSPYTLCDSCLSQTSIDNHDSRAITMEKGKLRDTILIDESIVNFSRKNA